MQVFSLGGKTEGSKIEADSSGGVIGEGAASSLPTS